MTWPRGTWVCPTGASHWIMEKPWEQREVTIGVEGGHKDLTWLMTWPNGYYSSSVVATGTLFGPAGTRHHHKDSGRSHDVANGYCGPSRGGHGDIIWSRWHLSSSQRLGEVP